MTAPLFSVIVPLYNKREYIVRSLSSVLAQTQHDFEIVVVDDGSTDGGADLVRNTFVDDRIRVVTQENSGEGAARNRGFREMRGSLAAFLDADDEWLPNHLEALRLLHMKFPAGLYTTGFRSVYSRGLVTDTTISEFWPTLISDYFQRATGGHFIHISASAIPRTVAEAVGFFAEKEPIGADEEIYAKIAIRRPIAYHPGISSIYHLDVPGSALKALRRHYSRPLPVRSLQQIIEAGPVHELPVQEVRRYIAWLVRQYVIAGYRCGNVRDASRLASTDLNSATEGAWVGLARRLTGVVPDALISRCAQIGCSRLFLKRDSDAFGVVCHVVARWDWDKQREG